jgi:hypothetical protein
MINETNNKIEMKVIDFETNEVYVGKILQERKSSYLIWFDRNVLPFSKKTGKIFGKNIQHYTYKLIMQGA